jgi:FkbM family methyltransferase
MDFLAEYLKIVDENISNDHKDNWDHYRYGSEPKLTLRQRATGLVKSRLNKRGFFDLRAFVNYNLIDALKFKYLFDNLETDEDRELLLKVLAYKLMGHRKIKLPLNTPEYWGKLKSLSELGDRSDVLNPNFLHYSLHKINLNKIGYPIEFYFSEGGIMTDFIVKQYEYNRKGKMIKVEKGDVVIDGGGCWGDTALYFANETGNNGQVYSFEFIPNNIQIFEKNVSLNENLKNTIELIANPIWSDSATRVFFKDFGPGSRVSMDELSDRDGEVTTLSIDDMVAQKGLKNLDFIKLDIEGAEMNALKGATNAIREFKPKLAVALYHSMDDFDRIPRLIRDIVPGYRFYFSHCTIYGEESMLFATID